jgi:hypothetical protein
MIQGIQLEAPLFIYEVVTLASPAEREFSFQGLPPYPEQWKKIRKWSPETTRIRSVKSKE